MQEKVLKKLENIESLMQWSRHIPAADRPQFLENVRNVRRELKKIQFALSENCSVATFGESQMGKSYLVSALLSDADHPFTVTDGQRTYNFINELNPSEKGTQREATGVVTRFTVNARNKNLPAGYLQARLLSVADIAIILCEAYYNQLTISTQDILLYDQIDAAIETVATGSSPFNSAFHKAFTEDDVLEIRDYLLNTKSLNQQTSNLTRSNLFKFLSNNLSRLSEQQIKDLLTMLWNRNADITRLFNDIISTYAQLGYDNMVYIPFEGVLRKHGTLLDVQRLDEMYAETHSPVEDYRESISVQTAQQSIQTTVKKSFLSALTAELTLSLPSEIQQSRPFLKDIDILDFPGARRPEQIASEKLTDPKNLSTILRRGKVTYLFNKYSDAKQITSLLFCHNNSQSAESAMGGLLDQWVNNTIGSTPEERERYIQMSTIAPLFIVGTWFNKDLEFKEQKKGSIDGFETIWNTRFRTVLEEEVLKTNSYTWFTQWTKSHPMFNNIYMLRDFYYSMKANVFRGWTESGSPEEEEIRPAEYPDFREDLKRSFCNYPFVKAHFDNPSQSWDDAATLRNDGTKRIIERLGEMAPHIASAREKKFSEDTARCSRTLMALTDEFYHPESGDEQVKLSIKQGRRTQLQLDTLFGRDHQFFGRMMDKMMVKEADVYERLHRILENYVDEPKSSNPYANIRLSVGISDSNNRESNIQQLMDYYGFDDEQECREEMEAQGIDFEVLISKGQTVSTWPEKLVDTIADYWHTDLLQDRNIRDLKPILPNIGVVVSKLWTLYQSLGVDKQIAEQVKQYIQTYERTDAIGIIADCIAMNLNRFITTFGYEFLSEEKKESLRRNSETNHWGLVFHSHDEGGSEKTCDISVLNLLEQIVGMINQGGAQNKELMRQFPQYDNYWKWCDYMRIGFICACDIPDYDTAANEALGRIRACLGD